MSVSKDLERGTYYAQCCYKDWMGEPKKKTKRGFKAKKEVRQWESSSSSAWRLPPCHAIFEFYEVSAEDTKMRLRRTTRETKANMIVSKTCFS